MINTINNSLDNDLKDSIRRHLKGRENFPSYQKWFDEYFYLENRHLKRLVPDLKQFTMLSKKKILDFGCGTGGSSVALALQGAEVVGIEPNPLSIDVALHRAKKYSLQTKIQFLQSNDTLNLPFEDQTFDICVCYSVLEYILKDRKKFIGEMGRVLKKDGIIFIGGTANGIWPIEMHSKKWWINYQKEVSENVSSTQGISFWEIQDVLTAPQWRCLNQELSENGLKRFQKRNPEKSLRNFALIGFLQTVRVSLCPIFKVPIDVFTPWLDLAFKKEI